MNTLGLTVTIIIGAAIVIFMYSRIRPFLQGPRIVAINIEETTYHDEYWIEVIAEVRNTQSALVNGVTTSINQNRELRYHLALVPGENPIEISLNGDFETSKKYLYRIITPPSEELHPSLYSMNEEEEETDKALPETEAPIEESMSNE